MFDQVTLHSGRLVLVGLGILQPQGEEGKMEVGLNHNYIGYIGLSNSKNIKKFYESL